MVAKKYSTEDYIKLYARQEGWSIECAVEAIRDAERRPEEAKEFWKYIYQTEIKKKKAWNGTYLNRIDK